MDHQARQYRPRAYNLPRQTHELTFSCYHRYPFLSKERTCEWLAQSIQDARTLLDYSLWAYVFMADHVHLIVFLNRIEYDVSEFLKMVKEPVSRRAIEFLRREASDWIERIRVTRGRKIEHHFWQQGRGYDRNIDNAKTLQMAIEYLHLNPIRKRLVELARDWKWSSAAWFEGIPLNDLKPIPIPLDWLTGM